MTAPAGIHPPFQPPPPFRSPSEHPSPAQILDSAAALARAEVKLLWSHARRLGERAAVAIALTWVAMMLTQIAVLLLAISPVIAKAYGGVTLAVTVAPAALLAAITWAVCAKTWLGLKPSAGDQQHKATTADNSLELSSGELGRR